MGIEVMKRKCRRSFLYLDVRNKLNQIDNQMKGIKAPLHEMASK